MSGYPPITLDNRARREWAKQLVEGAPDGYECIVRQKKRSNPQNDRMWAMLTDVSRSKPQGLEYTPEIWKAVFMQACGHEQRFLMGLDGNPFPAGFRSSKLNKAQMSDLMEFISAWGSENGVRWTE